MAIESKNLLAAFKAFDRVNSLPLDSSELHDSYEEAIEYIGMGSAYAGQTIKIKNENNKYDSYIIQNIDGELIPQLLTDDLLVKMKQEIADEIAKLIGGAPETFDTLKEISDWISKENTPINYINKEDENDVITVEEYNNLPEEEKEKYEANNALTLLGQVANNTETIETIKTGLEGKTNKEDVVGLIQSALGNLGTKVIEKEEEGGQIVQETVNLTVEEAINNAMKNAKINIFEFE